jgi:hypothetical protein
MKSKRRMGSDFRVLLKGLNEITKDCREDMHEPDEQEVYAEVRGEKLDNAFGEDTGPYTREFVVMLRNEITNKYFYINLASLIALARKAQLD